MATTKTSATIGPFTIHETNGGFGWEVFEGRYFEDGPYDTREEAVAAAATEYATRLRAKIEAILGRLEDDELTTISRLEAALDALNGV